MSDSENGQDRRVQLWRSVDPRIWAPSPPKGRLSRIVSRFRGIVAPLSFAALVGGGSLSVLLSFPLVYYAVGPSFLGPALILLWSGVVVGFVFILEKTGYARNFQNWEFPLGRRLLALPIAFLVIVGTIYLLYLFLRTG